MAANANRDCDVAPGELVQSHARVFDGTVTDLEHQSLLRIHAASFVGRDTEERGVKAIDVADETSIARVNRAPSGKVRMMECVGIPAIVGDLGDC